MTRHFCTRSALLTLALLIPACGGSDDSDSNQASAPTSPSPVPSPSPAPAPSNCTTSVTGVPQTAGSPTGRYTFTITAASNCNWTARTDAAWGSVSPGSGVGSATPVLTINQNDLYGSRTLTTTVNGQNFQTVQSGVTCSITLDRTHLDETFEGGFATLVLTTLDGCSWSVTASESWIHVVTQNGVGSGKVVVELQPNTGGPRNAFLMVAGQRVDVRQGSRG
jgi:hypothetical protein